MRIPSNKNQLFWIFLLVFAAMGIGFFIPASATKWGGYVIKAALFLILLVVSYVIVFYEDIRIGRSGSQPTDLDGIEEELPADQDAEETWIGFGGAFQNFYSEFLGIVRNAVVGSWAGIYLKKNDQLTFMAGDSKKEFVQSRMTVSSDDIVGRVAHEKRPILETNLPIGMRFTGIPNSEMRSFLGVPMLIEDQSSGVLAVGSEATESFGEEDQEFLMRCGKLAAQVMLICKKGLRWEMDKNIFYIYMNLLEWFETAETEDEILSLFVTGIKKVFTFDRFAFCMKEGDKAAIRFIYGEADGLEQGYSFTLDDGLNGWVLKRNTPLLIEDLEEGDYVRPRYSKDENSKHGLRSFIGVPLGKKNNIAWACLSLESSHPYQFSEKGKEVLQTLSHPLQMALEKMYLYRQLKDLANNETSSGSADFQLD